VAEIAGSIVVRSFIWSQSIRCPWDRAGLSGRTKTVHRIGTNPEMLLATKSVWTATVRCLRFRAFCGNSDLGTRLSRAPQHLAPKREQLSNSRGMFPQILMLRRRQNRSVPD
jgi:hypothetical protein